MGRGALLSDIALVLQDASAPRDTSIAISIEPDKFLQENAV